MPEEGNRMTFEEALYLLMSCKREELRDHAFGDAEVYWMKDGKEVAVGYYGTSSSVGIDGTSFTGEEAAKFRYVGRQGKIERNDETGPDVYAEGKCMSGLTLAGVFKELTQR